MDQQTGAAKTVLLVEDETSMNQIITTALQAEGLTVARAKNGKEGLGIALQQHPDIVLTDNFMPIMNGVDMVTELRKDAWGASVPVIIMTNKNDLNAINQSLQAGVTDYLMKADVGIEQIVAMVKTKLGLAA